MAVYIKKERLGSGPAPKVARKAFRRGVKFGIMAKAFEKAKEKKAQQLDDKYESNAEVQRFRTLTPEERGREAIDRMMPTAKAIVSNRKGSEATDDEARGYAEKLMNNCDRGKGQKKAKKTDG